MKEYLRFAVCYWHTILQYGRRSFRTRHQKISLDAAGDAPQRAKDKMDAAFEFITKLSVPYYCFHDIDLVRKFFVVEYEAVCRLLWNMQNRNRLPVG